MKVRGGLNPSTIEAMDLPEWVLETFRAFRAPETGMVLVNMEIYQRGITRVEIGGMVRVKPPPKP